MKSIKVRVTTFEPMLGTSASDPDIHATYIASKSEDKTKAIEEVGAVINGDVENEDGEFESRPITVFPRMEDGRPLIWDYQFKGFMKDTCKALKKVTGTKSSACKNYKQEIDSLIFVFPRQIEIKTSEPIGHLSRPLRAQTPMGERCAIADSECIAPGAVMEFEIRTFVDADMAMVKEWLDYGQFRGLLQWRNSGMGRFHYEILEESKGNWDD